MESHHLKNQPYSVLFFTLLFFVNGCAYFSADADYSAPPALPEPIKASYAHQQYQGDYKSKLLDKTSHYTLQQISFPAQHDTLQLQHEITIDYYALHSPEKSPIILVLPIFGGNNSISSIFARYFAKHGFAAAIVHRQNKYKEIGYLSHPNQIMRQIILDHKQALDWIESRPELDSTRIGVFGVSMGGIKGALLSALDKRVSASVLALAGGDLPYILAHTDENKISNERKVLLAKENISLQELQQRLSTEIESDPLNYAQYIDAGNTLMILAVFDRTVAFHKGVELKKKIGNPDTIYLLSGHYSAIIYLPYVRYQARKFLQRKLH